MLVKMRKLVSYFLFAALIAFTARGSETVGCSPFETEDLAESVVLIGLVGTALPLYRSASQQSCGPTG